MNETLLLCLLWLVFPTLLCSSIIMMQMLNSDVEGHTVWVKRIRNLPLVARIMIMLFLPVAVYFMFGVAIMQGSKQKGE